MCYIIITGGSLSWFLLSLIADMLIASAIVTPKWLIGPLEEPDQSPVTNITTYRYPSFGIYTRCKIMKRVGYNCGSFDFNGFYTDNDLYPPEWKATMFFMSLGFAILSTTIAFIFLSCCRQSLFGKSIHNLTGCLQVIAAICIMIALFLYPLAWGTRRIVQVCGPDAEPFYPGMCSIGWSFYCAVTGIVICFICAGISLKAESGNMRSKVRRRVEEGERLVCIP